MAVESVRQIFEKIGAIRQGHFLLPSGHHTSEFWEKFVLLQHPDAAYKLVTMVANRCRDVSAAYVAGPALGGMILAYELARQLSCQAIYIEKTCTPGVLTIGRGVVVTPHAPVILIDDFLSTGQTLAASFQALQTAGADLKKAVMLVDRRGGTPPEHLVPLAFPIDALLVVNEPPNIAAHLCPLCVQRVPLVDPKTLLVIPGPDPAKDGES